MVADGAVVERHQGNPLQFIAAWQERLRPAVTSGLPRFWRACRKGGRFALAVRGEHQEPRFGFNAERPARGTA